MSVPPGPGWYPDPQDAARRRWWDGNGWTDRVETAAPPAGFGPPAGPAAPVTGAADSGMAALAHVLAIPAAFFGLAFLGPLAIYLLRPNDPLVRANAAEALNFQLSLLLYLAVSGVVVVLFADVTLGVVTVLAPLYGLAGIAWFVLILRAASKAGQGEVYRYPFAIRFVG